MRRGLNLGAGYNLSNNVVLTFVYRNAFNLRSHLNSVGFITTAVSLADRNNVQIIQADITVKL